jgi:creatinine amidohydrolase
MWWHEQSWPRIQAIDKSIPVIVPLGSIEQHGHHLPLSVDTTQVTAIAERAEKQLGATALFLPTLWLGCSEHHKDFPGTVSVGPSLYSENIKSITRSVLRAGFGKVFFLNGHGGNEIPAAQALTELVAEDDAADAAYLVFSSWWQVGRDALAPQRHGMTTPAINHACEYETSMMLALRGDLVDLIAAADQSPVLQSPWLQSAGGAKVRQFRRFHRLTAGGSIGRPSAGTKEKGAAMLDAVTADVVAFMRDFATWPELPAIGPKRPEATTRTATSQSAPAGGS